MRVLALFLCATLGACSPVEGISQDDVTPPDQLSVLKGLKKAVLDAKLAEPIEVSDPVRPNSISSTAWLICLRSGISEESKRVTYSAFFNKEYVSSRWSAVVDPCSSQAYHVVKLDMSKEPETEPTPAH
jgi:hypothetical protein